MHWDMIWMCCAARMSQQVLLDVLYPLYRPGELGVLYEPGHTHGYGIYPYTSQDMKLSMPHDLSMLYTPHEAGHDPGAAGCPEHAQCPTRARAIPCADPE